MYRPSKDQLKAWLAAAQPAENLRETLRQSPTTPLLLEAIRREIPDVAAIPQLTYTLYREFERTGLRGTYENPYFLKRAKLTRAVLEGVSFGLRDSMELVKQAGLGSIKQVRLTGGGARSALWRQILADVMGESLVTVNTTEGAAFGAALLAGVGAGAWASVPEACGAAIRVVDQVEPTVAQVAAYEDLYPLYRGLYPALKPTFEVLR